MPQCLRWCWVSHVHRRRLLKCICHTFFCYFVGFFKWFFQIICQELLDLRVKDNIFWVWSCKISWSLYYAYKLFVKMLLREHLCFSFTLYHSGGAAKNWKPIIADLQSDLWFLWHNSHGNGKVWYAKCFFFVFILFFINKTGLKFLIHL